MINKLVFWIFVVILLLIGLFFFFNKEEAVQVDGLLLERDVAYGELREQKMDIYYFSEEEKTPLVVFVHGGGWTSGDKRSVEYYRGFFIERKVAVASINYRLVVGEENRFPIPIEDVACAVAFLKNNADKYGFDDGKIILAGHSAGGHLAAMVAYNPEGNWLEDCDYGSNLKVVGFIGSSGVYDFDSTNPRRKERELAGLFGENDEALGEPIKFVDDGDPKALLITGSEDCFLNVQEGNECVANSRNFNLELQEKGIESKLVVIEGYRHNDVMKKFDVNLELREAVEEFVTNILDD